MVVTAVRERKKKALVVSCCVTRLNSFARAYFVESGVTRRIALHASQNQLTFCVLFPGYVWWLWLKVAWAKRGRRRAFAVRHVHKARDSLIHKCTLFHCRYWSRGRIAATYGSQKDQNNFSLRFLSTVSVWYLQSTKLCRFYVWRIYCSQVTATARVGWMDMFVIQFWSQSNTEISFFFVCCVGRRLYYCNCLSDIHVLYWNSFRSFLSHINRNRMFTIYLSSNAFLLYFFLSFDFLFADGIIKADNVQSLPLSSSSAASLSQSSAAAAAATATAVASATAPASSNFRASSAQTAASRSSGIIGGITGIAAPAAAAVTSMDKSQLSSDFYIGPYLDGNEMTNITVQVGTNAYLPCKVWILISHHILSALFLF